MFVILEALVYTVLGLLVISTGLSIYTQIKGIVTKPEQITVVVNNSTVSNGKDFMKQLDALISDAKPQS